MERTIYSSHKRSQSFQNLLFFILFMCMITGHLSFVAGISLTKDTSVNPFNTLCYAPRYNKKKRHDYHLVKKKGNPQMMVLINDYFIAEVEVTLYYLPDSSKREKHANNDFCEKSFDKSNEVTVSMKTILDGNNELYTSANVIEKSLRVFDGCKYLENGGYSKVSRIFFFTPLHGDVPKNATDSQKKNAYKLNQRSIQVSLKTKGDPLEHSIDSSTSPSSLVWNDESGKTPYVKLSLNGTISLNQLTSGPAKSRIFNFLSSTTIFLIFACCVLSFTILSRIDKKWKSYWINQFPLDELSLEAKLTRLCTKPKINKMKKFPLQKLMSYPVLSQRPCHTYGPIAKTQIGCHKHEVVSYVENSNTHEYVKPPPNLIRILFPHLFSIDDLVGNKRKRNDEFISKTYVSETNDESVKKIKESCTYNNEDSNNSSDGKPNDLTAVSINSCNLTSKNQSSPLINGQNESTSNDVISSVCLGERKEIQHSYFLRSKFGRDRPVSQSTDNTHLTISTKNQQGYHTQKSTNNIMEGTDNSGSLVSPTFETNIPENKSLDTEKGFSSPKKNVSFEYGSQSGDETDGESSQEVASCLSTKENQSNFNTYSASSSDNSKSSHLEGGLDIQCETEAHKYTENNIIHTKSSPCPEPLKLTDSSDKSKSSQVKQHKLEINSLSRRLSFTPSAELLSISDAIMKPVWEYGNSLRKGLHAGKEKIVSNKRNRNIHDEEKLRVNVPTLVSIPSNGDENFNPSKKRKRSIKELNSVKRRRSKRSACKQ